MLLFCLNVGFGLWKFGIFGWNLFGWLMLWKIVVCLIGWKNWNFFFYCKVFKVVVVMDFFKKNIVGCGIVLEKIEVVKNGVYFDKF